MNIRDVPGRAADPRLFELAPTLITYPSGECRADAGVLHIVPDPRSPESPRPHDEPRTQDEPRTLVITDVTPFHPLDPLWPDQPGDHGRLIVDGQARTIHETVTVAQRKDGPVMVGDAIDARRGAPDVVFLVAHVVDTAANLAPGARVTLAVDQVRRRRLSAAHTACHLLAYALNQATHDLWRKPAPTDSRGHHDLDAATCVLTRHDTGGSLDRYRLGKSLRKKGFDTDRFLAELSAIIDEVEHTLAKWIAADAPVRVECEGPRLTDRREWICETPGGTARMPCGGTHVRRLGEIDSMTADASFDAQEGILTIRNDVRTTVKGLQE